MRHSLLLTGFLLLLPAAAHAQVTIDLRALEALPPAPSSAPPPSHRAPRQVLRVVPAGPLTTTTLPEPPVPPGAAAAPDAAGRTTASITSPTATPGKPTVTTPTVTTPTVTGPTAPISPTSPTPPTASLPTAPPAVATLAPIAPTLAPAMAPPPAPPPVSATAGTTAAPENGGLSLIFKPDEADLSPATASAIGALVKATPAGETITFNVVAYAKSVADDPSAARRTSLARGLSVRAALIADGVPSTRIYVRALGANGGGGPPDRVDLTILGASGVATSAGATAAGGSARP